MLTAREFRPELMSRRGEFLSWLVSLSLVLALTLGTMNWGPLSWLFWLFAGFMLLSAMSISLGNWVDRRSVIRVDSNGIAFQNGLRSVRLAWPEVQGAAVTESRLGKRVQVLGAKSHFTFRMMGEAVFNGQLQRTGFAAGQEILETILLESGVKFKAEKDGMSYYSRA